MRPARRGLLAAGGAGAGVAAIVLLRSPGFSPSVIDWDESVYLLVSRGLLRGHAPYTVIWDHKPPGLYTLFAAFQIFFGETVASVRLGAALAVAATCILLFVAGRRLFGSAAAGAVAATLYAGQSLRSGGLAANAEILFAPFAAAGFLVLAGTSAPARGRALAAGFLFGLAAQVKTVAGFEFAAVLGLSCALAAADREAGWWVALRRGAIASAGFLATFALSAGAFAAAGRLPEYLHANFAANAAYVSTERVPVPELWDAFRAHADRNPYFWSGAALLPLGALFARRSARLFLRPGAFALAWLAGATAGLVSIGRTWDHYFLTLLPALALLAGASVASVAGGLAPSRARFARAAAAAAVAALLVGAPLLYAVSTLRHPEPPDTPRRVAAYLSERIAPGDVLYVPDFEPILHYLVDAQIPTRYVLPYDLMDPAFAQMAGVDRFAEIERIFARAPAWVVRRARLRIVPGAPAFYAALDRHLDRDYVAETRIGDAVLYRRR